MTFDAPVDGSVTAASAFLIFLVRPVIVFVSSGCRTILAVDLTTPILSLHTERKAVFHSSGTSSDPSDEFLYCLIILVPTMTGTCELYSVTGLPILEH